MWGPPTNTHPKEVAALPKPNVAGAIKSYSEGCSLQLSLRKEGATFLGSSPSVDLNLLLKINFIIYCNSVAPIGSNVAGIYSVVPQHH